MEIMVEMALCLKVIADEKPAILTGATDSNNNADYSIGLLNRHTLKQLHRPWVLINYEWPFKVFDTLKITAEAFYNGSDNVRTKAAKNA